MWYRGHLNKMEGKNRPIEMNSEKKLIQKREKEVVQMIATNEVRIKNLIVNLIFSCTKASNQNNSVYFISLWF